MRFDENQVRQAVRLLHDDALFELRYVAGKKIYTGYFKGADKLIAELELLPDSGGNVYITLQDINDSCYNREQKDKVLFGKPTTSDGDISGYITLLIDLDPVRPAGVGSTVE